MQRHHRLAIPANLLPSPAHLPTHLPPPLHLLRLDLSLPLTVRLFSPSYPNRPLSTRCHLHPALPRRQRQRPHLPPMPSLPLRPQHQNQGPPKFKFPNPSTSPPTHPPPIPEPTPPSLRSSLVLPQNIHYPLQLLRTLQQKNVSCSESSRKPTSTGHSRTATRAGLTSP
jgi:hypothetical protein